MTTITKIPQGEQGSEAPAESKPRTRHPINVAASKLAVASRGYDQANARYTRIMRDLSDAEKVRDQRRAEVQAAQAELDALTGRSKGQPIPEV